MSTALRAVPISEDWSDVELVAAVRRGNDFAFAELYSRYSHRIGSYVRGMVGDHGRAEDVTQEIFIAALRRMRATDRPIAFKAWIYEIAKNACIDSFRRSRRAQEISLDADDSLSPADRGRLTAVTTLDAALESKQALDDLRGAFGGLSDSHHEILVLRELEGRSYSDIGKRLGMSRPVVESTLFRARRRLAEEYEEHTSGRRCEFVRKTVDSGPHYSLGIRDRRRMARHFAHCQSCRTHARLAGFDESILNMPSVAARMAALAPIPLLRARWDALGGEAVGADQARPSVLALRSVQTLARSSDQIVGAGTGAGRAGATAAALVLASVGGGIATVTSSQPVTRLHQSGAQLIASGIHHSTLVPVRGPAQVLKGSVRGREMSVTSAHVVSFSSVAGAGGTGMPVGSRTTGPGSSNAVAAAGPAASSTAPSGAGAAAPTSGAGDAAGSTTGSTAAPSTSSAGGAGAASAATTGGTGGTSAATTGGAGDPTSTDTSVDGDPTAAGTGDPTSTGTGTGGDGDPSATGAGGDPAGTPQLPGVGTLPTRVVLSGSTGGVTAAPPQLPPNAGGAGGSNPSPPRPVGYWGRSGRGAAW